MLAMTDGLRLLHQAAARCHRVLNAVDDELLSGSALESDGFVRKCTEYVPAVLPSLVRPQVASVIAVLAMSGLAMSGLAMSGFAMSGLAISGFDVGIGDVGIGDVGIGNVRIRDVGIGDVRVGNLGLAMSGFAIVGIEQLVVRDGRD